MSECNYVSCPSSDLPRMSKLTVIDKYSSCLSEQYSPEIACTPSDAADEAEEEAASAAGKKGGKAAAAGKKRAAPAAAAAPKAKSGKK